MNLICDIKDYFDPDKIYSLGDFAMYSIVGLLIVISALAILVLLLTLVSKVVNSSFIENFGKKKEKKEVKTEVKNETNDDELVAVISAAIAAVMDSEGKKSGTAPVPFIIKSIRKN